MISGDLRSLNFVAYSLRGYVRNKYLWHVSTRGQFARFIDQLQNLFIHFHSDLNSSFINKSAYLSLKHPQFQKLKPD